MIACPHQYCISSCIFLCISSWARWMLTWSKDCTSLLTWRSLAHSIRETHSPTPPLKSHVLNIFVFGHLIPTNKLFWWEPLRRFSQFPKKNPKLKIAENLTFLQFPKMFSKLEIREENYLVLYPSLVGVDCIIGLVSLVSIVFRWINSWFSLGH